MPECPLPPRHSRRAGPTLTDRCGSLRPAVWGEQNPEAGAWPQPALRVAAGLGRGPRLPLPECQPVQPGAPHSGWDFVLGLFAPEKLGARGDLLS